MYPEILLWFNCSISFIYDFNYLNYLTLLKYSEDFVEYFSFQKTNLHFFGLNIIYYFSDFYFFPPHFWWVWSCFSRSLLCLIGLLYIFFQCRLLLYKLPSLEHLNSCGTSIFIFFLFFSFHLITSITHFFTQEHVIL